MKGSRRKFIKAGALLVPAYMAGLSGIIRAGSAPSLKVAGTARVGTLSRPAGGASAQWYYSDAGEGESGFPTSADWALTSWATGDLVTVTTGGDITKISYKSGTTAGSDVEIGLFYNNAGTYTETPDACGTIASPSSSAWNDFTVGTAYTVADGATVLVMMRSNSTFSIRSTDETNVAYADNVGAGVCDLATITNDSPQNRRGIRVYVEP